MSTPKKHRYTHMQIQENLHFFSMSFYILKSLHDILLSVVIIYVNIGRCDHFILLSLNNIFIFKQLAFSICYYLGKLHFTHLWFGSF